MKTRVTLLFACAITCVSGFTSAQATNYIDPPMFAEEIKAGKLPPAAKRIPENPLVVKMDGGAVAGQHGGTLNMLIGRSRDVRMLVVYGYARLVAYDRELKIVPD